MAQIKITLKKSPISQKEDQQLTVRSLGLGAADFIPKPFRVRELLARVKAHLRVGRELNQARAEADVAAVNAFLRDPAVPAVKIQNDKRWPYAANLHGLWNTPATANAPAIAMAPVSHDASRCGNSVTAPISQLPTCPVTRRNPRPPRRLFASTRASSSNVVISGVNASLRRRQTSMVARPYSKKTRRANRSASPLEAMRAREKFSAIPFRVERRTVTAIEFPTVEIAFRTNRGSQRAP